MEVNTIGRGIRPNGTELPDPTGIKVTAANGPVPGHIGFIMDGNGRWARARGQMRIFGHRAGVKTAADMVAACRDMGVQVVTLYAFSTENWVRPEDEVKGIFGLLEEFFSREAHRLSDSGVRVQVIGDIGSLPSSVRYAVQQAVSLSSDATRMTANVALSYGGRWDIVQAAKAIAYEVKRGHLKESDIDEALFSSFISTHGQPDPDLIIRTGGEMRLSNFLLWQAAYSEIWVTEKLWPDFTEEDLFAAVRDYRSRERRYGSVGVRR